jgi:choline dehydrogenase-like flavoprotein
MVSGIGPADTLKEHGIDVVSDLPGVGQNESVREPHLHGGRRIS